MVIIIYYILFIIYYLLLIIYIYYLIVHSAHSNLDGPKGCLDADYINSYFNGSTLFITLFPRSLRNDKLSVS